MSPNILYIHNYDKLIWLTHAYMIKARVRVIGSSRNAKNIGTLEVHYQVAKVFPYIIDNLGMSFLVIHCGYVMSE